MRRQIWLQTTEVLLPIKFASQHFPVRSAMLQHRYVISWQPYCERLVCLSLSSSCATRTSSWSSVQLHRNKREIFLDWTQPRRVYLLRRTRYHRVKKMSSLLCDATRHCMPNLTFISVHKHRTYHVRKFLIYFYKSLKSPQQSDEWLLLPLLVFGLSFLWLLWVTEVDGACYT